MRIILGKLQSPNLPTPRPPCGQHHVDGTHLCSYPYADPACNIINDLAIRQIIPPRDPSDNPSKKPPIN